MQRRGQWCAAVSAGLCLATAALCADAPFKTILANVERNDYQWDARVSHFNSITLRAMLYQGSQPFTNPAAYSWRFLYARNDSATAMVSITGSVIASNQVDFAAQTNDFPAPVSRWYSVILGTSTNSEAISFARGWLTVDRAPEINSEGALRYSVPINGSAYGPFTGSFAGWPFASTSAVLAATSLLSRVAYSGSHADLNTAEGNGNIHLSSAETGTLYAALLPPATNAVVSWTRSVTNTVYAFMRSATNAVAQWPVSTFTNDAGYVTQTVTNGLAGPNVTNGLAAVSWVRSTTNAVAGWLPGLTNPVPSWIVASTTPVPGWVAAGTNGVAGWGYVTQAVTNGLEPSAHASATYLPKAATNGFVTASVTNGLEASAHASATYLPKTGTNGLAPTAWVRVVTGGLARISGALTNGNAVLSAGGVLLRDGGPPASGGGDFMADGSVAMTGNLDMGGFIITNCATMVDTNLNGVIGNGAMVEAAGCSENGVSGSLAMYAATNCHGNGVSGYMAMQSATNCINNGVSGVLALNGAYACEFNGVSGYAAMNYANGCYGNGVSGYAAMNSVYDCDYNGVIGNEAMVLATNCDYNGVVGYSAMYLANGCDYNGVSGGEALYAADNCNYNGVSGYAAMRSATNATYSGALGSYAGRNATGAARVYIDSRSSDPGVAYNPTNDAVYIDAGTVHAGRPSGSLYLRGTPYTKTPTVATGVANKGYVDGATNGNFRGEQITSGTVADARIASTIARDSEVVAATNGNFRGEQITSGTVADARIASTIARDTEVAAATNTLATTASCYGFAAYRNASYAPTNSTWTRVICDTESYDPKGWHNTTTGIATPNVAGMYLISAHVEVAALADTKLVAGWISKNGSRAQVLKGPQHTTEGAANIGVNWSCVIDNDGNDKFQLEIYESDTGTEDAAGSWWSMQLLR